MIYTPKRLQDLYLWQEKNLRIERVPNLSGYSVRKKRFLSSREGRKFLSYRTKKITNLNGVAVWLVDGIALRGGLKAGDIDFTMGGHGYRYLYIPEEEIWIDKATARRGDLEPVIWHEYLERNLMKNGMSYDEAHTIASDLETTLREGTYFVLPVGTFRQTAGLCGPAALKIVLDYYQYQFTEKELAQLCQTTEAGTDPQKMVEAAQKIGLQSSQKENMATEEVKKIVRSGTPIIANFQLKPEKGEGHYAVIVGYSRDTFILSDPQEKRGYREVKIKDFMRLWYELEDRTSRQGILLNLHRAHRM
ncbi:MAG TPA: cysteine peptidase family C39 domain-containing protein [Patescibacteria group bacterium]|nr:cysteine peptidase family C39 domain-containing protein [Patescibacteria group bacterium]